MTQPLAKVSLRDFIFCIFFVIFTGCATAPLSHAEIEEEALKKGIDLSLVKYVAIDDEACTQREVLRIPAEPVQFPLSDEDRKIGDTLKYKCLEEDNCAGLAAPQIGYGKKVIFFHVTEDVQNFRSDMYGVVPPTVLYNPSYEPIGTEKKIDWEACFSVLNSAGEVPRFTGILYQGQNENGEIVKSAAFGFLARLIQHEIGHLNGELWIDLLTEGCQSGSRESMTKLRMKELKKQKQKAKPRP